MSLCDPLRAERDVRLNARRAKPPLHRLAGTREDRRAQDDQRAVLHVGCQLVEDLLENPYRRVHELVDRRADDEDHRAGAPEHRRVPGQLEPAGRQQLGQEGLVRAGFDSNLTLLLDIAFDEPALPAGRFKLAGSRRRSHGQLAAYEDAVVLTADIQRIGPDVYHAIDLHLPGRSPCPVVVTLHDLIPWAWGGPRMLGERFRYLAGRRLLRRADLLIAVSNATAEDARRLRMAAPGRIRVIPEAAGPVFAPRQGAAARVKDRWSLGGSYLLFVGALDARKDPRALLQAWRTARLLHPGLQLVIAGDPGRQAPASMEGAVRLGRVDDEALADLYSAAGCLVFPSRYEVFGLPCV